MRLFSLPRLKSASMIVAASAILYGLTSSSVFAEEKDVLRLSRDILLQADSIRYDSEKQRVEAFGNVEIARGDYLLTADQILYQEKEDRLEATGRVQIFRGKESALLADKIVLEDGFERSFMEKPALRWGKSSRLAAAYASRQNERSHLFSAIYSPCPLCRRQGRTTPLWQIRAQNVVHDEPSQTVVYQNAFLEFLGIPIFYLPVFWHPSPEVQRKGGLLVPSFQTSSFFGVRIALPIFFNINPQTNFTFTPVYSARRGMVFDLNMEQRLRSGPYNFWGTATWPTRGARKFRGHIFGKGRFHLGQSQRTGFDLQLSTDDTYLRNYRLTDDTELTSRVFYESTSDRHIFSLSGYFFQSLVEEPLDEGTPFAGPIMEYIYKPEASFLEGQLSLETNVRALTRSGGIDSQRLSLGGKWENQQIGTFGLLELFTELRWDIYSYTSGLIEDRFQNRILPLFGASWSFPLFREGGEVSQTLEPRVQIIYSEALGDKAIINEDSPTPEFDATNLFNRNRFPGFDRWEESFRTNVGVSYSLQSRYGGALSFLIGQSFRTRDSSLDNTRTGLGTRSSDVIGQIVLTPGEYLSFSHKFRADRKTWSLKRSEIDLDISYGPLSAYIIYADLDASFGEDLGARSEIYTGAVLRLSRNWQIYGSLRRDIRNNRSVGNRLGILYKDNCFEASLTYKADFTDDRDIQPDTGIALRISLRTLGGGRITRRGFQ